MATYYWVGGAGTWNASSTTNWASSSNGAGGAGVPTSADNVVFDTSSGTGTVTCSNNVCRNLTVTATQALTFGGTFSGLYGSISLPTGGSFVFAAPVVFRATTTGNTLNFGDKTLGNYIQFVGSGGEWTLVSNFTTSNQVQFINGTFNANGYTLTANSGFYLGNGSVFVLNMGSSTFNAGGANPWAFSITTNFTINPGTSTIVVTQNASAFNGKGYTYYNLTRTNTQGSWTINGANTFNNVTIAATTNTTLTTSFSANQTINGSLTVTGDSSTNRIQFASSVAGTQRTLSVATIGTLTNTNFKDINLTGAASPWSAPLGVWDLGNNSGITFDTTTLYWIGGTGVWTDAAEWSTSSGGTGGAGYPGPTNNVVFDSNSGTGSVTGSGTCCKDLTATASQSLQLNTALSVYGSVSLPSGGSFSLYFNQAIVFSGTTTGKTITTNGKAMPAVTFNGIGSEWTLTDNFIGGQGFIITNGSVIANISTLTVQACSIAAGASLTLGNTTVSINGGQSWTCAAGATFNCGTSTISGPLSDFNGGGKTYYNVSLGAGDITGANTYNTLTLTGPASTGIQPFTIDSTQTVNSTFTVTGANGNRRVFVRSNTFGVQRTITAAAVSLTDVDFYGIVGAGTATWSGTRIGDGTLNSGITFSSPKTVYWNLAAGGNWMGNAWATSSGGTPATTNFPLPQDTAIIEDTGLNSGATINTYPNAYILFPKIDCSTRTLPVVLKYDQTGAYMCGDLIFNSAVTFSNSNNPFEFFGTTSISASGTTIIAGMIVTAGASLTVNNALTSNAGLTNNGTLTLGANATFTTMALNGTTNLSTYTLAGTTCTLGAASTTNFGTGKITLSGATDPAFTGNNTQTVTGSRLVEFTAPSGTFVGANGATPTEGNTISVSVPVGTAASSYQFALLNSFNNVDFTGYTGSLRNTSSCLIYGNLTLSSSMAGTANSNGIRFVSTSGTKTITTNGRSLDSNVTFNGVGGTWQLADNLTMGSTRNINHTNGTIDINGKTLTCLGYSTSTGTKNITFNGGVLSLSGFTNNAPINFSTTAGTGTGKISMTGATAKTFVGGGSTYNCTLEQAGAGALTISGNNTFAELSNSVQPTQFTFTSGTTQNIAKWSINGTAGNLVTLAPSSTTNYTLNYIGVDTVEANYLSISRSTATPTLTWLALNSTNGGNNSGWYFDAFPAALSANGLLFGSNF